MWMYPVAWFKQSIKLNYTLDWCSDCNTIKNRDRQHIVITQRSTKIFVVIYGGTICA